MKDLYLTIALVIILPVVIVYCWMTASCNERAEMEGYTTNKTVALKCYGSYDGKTWNKIWY